MSVEKSCSLCMEPLTCDNIVNTKCRHSCCCDCFWKWAEQSNQCPYCRKEMIQNPDRATYLELGKDIDRRQQRIDHLRAEYNMLGDMCQNKSIALVNLGLDYDQLRLELKCLEHTHYDLTQKISASQHEEYEINRRLVRKEALVKQVALWEKNPQRAIMMWKKERLQQQHQSRRTCLRRLRTCFMEMSLVFSQRFESSSLRHALYTVRRMKSTISTIKNANRLVSNTLLTQEQRIVQMPDLCITKLWLDDEDRADARRHQQIVSKVAHEAVNAYFYLAHCSCSRIGAILATEPRATSQQHMVRHFEAVRCAHQSMAALRLRQSRRFGLSANTTGLEHIRPYRTLPAYTRLAASEPVNFRADAPSWDPLTNRIETNAFEEVPDRNANSTPDSDTQLAAQLLQQMIQNGQLSSDVREVEVRISNHRSVVFSRY